jgi:hypothetical protein
MSTRLTGVEVLATRTLIHSAPMQLATGPIMCALGQGTVNGMSLILPPCLALADRAGRHHA